MTPGNVNANLLGRVPGKKLLFTTAGNNGIFYGTFSQTPPHDAGDGCCHEKVLEKSVYLILIAVLVAFSRIGEKS
jgi:hypothetical protein